MTLPLSALLVLLAGCSKEAAEDTSCFWCVDSGETATTSTDDTSTDTKDDSKDDTPKSDSWTSTVSMDFSSGTISYTRIADNEVDYCLLAAELSALTVVKDCASCAFALEMTLGMPEVTEDGGACDDIADIEAKAGAVVAYGQGTTSYGEYHGIEYFDLQVRSEGAWSASDGFSALYSHGGEEYWYFGTK